MAELLSYRANRQHIPGQYSDIFDGSHYQALSKTELIVEGIPHGVKYFECPNDIVLGLMSDGVQVFKKIRKGTASAWPFVLINYSLSSEIRIFLKYMLPILLAPGPHSPKDHNSFVFPFSVEMIQLGHGVGSWHVLTREIFLLRAFLITKIADMQALKANQYLKGPNGFSPCRACRIQGCRRPTNDDTKTNYYYPLQAPKGAIRLDGSPGVDWDPADLPLRTDAGFEESIHYIRAGLTDIERKRRAKTQGINGESLFVLLPGFSRTKSCPHECMHLLWENILPTLVNLWTGRFKGLGEGTGGYMIQKYIWDLIGEETAAATASIPAGFSRAIPDIASERRLFTAEAWGFWTMYLAPYLLEGRLGAVYYKHFLLLVDIIKMLLQFVITNEEVNELEEKIVRWVREYEK
jgi:hypothetical protein